jgi:hypothetical protein
MLVTKGSVTVVLLKIANASRWRSGDEGAVNWKTAWNRCQACERKGFEAYLPVL